MTSGDGCWNCACKWCWYRGKQEYPFKCLGYIKQVDVYYSDHT